MTKTARRWFYQDGDNRRTTIAHTKKEAADLFGVSQYALDRKGGLLPNDATANDDNGNGSTTGSTRARSSSTKKKAATSSAPTPEPTPEPASDATTLPPVPPAPDAEANPADPNWDAVIDVTEWSGLKEGDAVKFDGQPRGHFEFRRYYKSATQEFVEIYGGIGGKLKLRPVKPDQIHPKTAGRTRKSTTESSAGELLP